MHHCRADEPDTPCPLVLQAAPSVRVALPLAEGGSKIVDLTGPLTGAIAHEIWRHAGGNSVVNWLQAEAILHNLARFTDAEDAPAPTTKAQQLRIAA